MQPSDLARLVTLSDPRVCGDDVVYVRTSIDLEEDRYTRQLWIHDGRGDRKLTAGPADSSPRWAPDGSRIAFLRSRDSKPAQVAVLPADGGEAEVITDFDLGVEALEWSPDGSQIAVTAVTWHGEWQDLDDEERESRPRRITSVPYRFDNQGWTHDRRRHIWLVDANGESDPDCLTPGEYDEGNPAWSPDGSRIAFVSDRSPRRGLEPGTQVFEVSIVGERVVVAVVDEGWWVLPSYRPDGVLHVIGHVRPDWPRVVGVNRVEDDGSVTSLTAHLDRPVVTLVAGPPRVAWRGDTAYTYWEDSGAVNIVAVPPDGSAAVVVGGPRVVSGFDVDERRIVFTSGETPVPSRLVESAKGMETSLTTPDCDLEIQPTEHFRVSSGGEEIDVWVVLPAGDETVPVLLNIHGGPASQYGFGFFDEFQVYAGAGFGVVACNPRGSSGRSEDFLRAVVGEAWGVVDVEDVTAALDESLERFPRLDPDRIGIMGGSYGGFLTAWMIGRDSRFKSAVVERGLLSWTSFSGTSDIAGVFPELYLDAPHPDNWSTLWEKSPLAVADRVRTPTLVLHAESDFRCPIEQAEQYFMALLRNGTPTELLRFPGEGHEMSRSGKPRHRVERFDAIIEWHRRWLTPGDQG